MHTSTHIYIYIYIAAGSAGELGEAGCAGSSHCVSSMLITGQGAWQTRPEPAAAAAGSGSGPSSSITGLETTGACSRPEPRTGGVHGCAGGPGERAGDVLLHDAKASARATCKAFLRSAGESAGERAGDALLRFAAGEAKASDRAAGSSLVAAPRPGFTA